MKKLFRIIESQDWNIEDEGDSYRISKYSNAGEDFSFSISKGTLTEMKEAIIDYAEDFDAGEHAAFWVEHRNVAGTPQSIRELLDDADSIDKMLQELSEKLEEELK